MSPKIQRWLVVAGLALTLVGANLTVMGHEDTLEGGQVMYLELAPVDPRSIMQGDYMALRFAVGNVLPKDAPEHGSLVVKLDTRKVASLARIHRGEALAADERLLEYRLRNGRPRIITDAYYFQEGQGARYRNAKYGEVRAREDGVALLVALADAELRPLDEGLGRPR